MIDQILLILGTAASLLCRGQETMSSSQTPDPTTALSPFNQSAASNTSVDPILNPVLVPSTDPIENPTLSCDPGWYATIAMLFTRCVK